MALGAQRTAIVREVLVRGLQVAGLGVVIGLTASLPLTRLLGSQLAGVSATDPLTFAVSFVVLIGTAALACVIPARRASRVDPIETLRVD
jgi:putative ABC transport system permease protein